MWKVLLCHITYTCIALAFFSDFTVSKYTREAGVRTFERRIAAVCRAVAVRVAESSMQSKKDKLENASSEKKNVVNDSLTDDHTRDATALAHPPEMPIVIDEVAVEDILGVSIEKCEHFNVERWEIILYYLYSPKYILYFCVIFISWILGPHWFAKIKISVFSEILYMQMFRENFEFASAQSCEY